LHGGPEDPSPVKKNSHWESSTYITQRESTYGDTMERGQLRWSRPDLGVGGRELRWSKVEPGSTTMNQKNS